MSGGPTLWPPRCPPGILLIRPPCSTVFRPIQGRYDKKAVDCYLYSATPVYERAGALPITGPGAKPQERKKNEVHMPVMRHITLAAKG